MAGHLRHTPRRATLGTVVFAVGSSWCAAAPTPDAVLSEARRYHVLPLESGDSSWRPSNGTNAVE